MLAAESQNGFGKRGQAMGEKKIYPFGTRRPKEGCPGRT